MASSIWPFVNDNIRSWFRARGFLMILAAALIAPGLTLAWVGTHQSDLAVTEIRWTPDVVMEGDQVNITAVVTNLHDGSSPSLNLTVRIGFYEALLGGEPTFREQASRTFRIPELAPGAKNESTMTWTAAGGTFLVEASVDPDGDLPEIEELNNLRTRQIYVGFAPIRAPFQPTPPAAGNNTTLPEVDAGIGELAWEPRSLFQNDQGTVRVEVINRGPDALRNATVRLQVHRAAGGGFAPFPSPDLSSTVSVEPGGRANATFDWRPGQVGLYAVVAILDAGAVARDTDSQDNAVIRQTFIDRRITFDEPEPQATAKSFYANVLEILHLTFLIPLIGLFYAAGVLEDERERGNLAYILTRPVPRWVLPLARFAVSFVVAGAALLAGVFLTYVLLLQQPQAAPGFLYYPLLFTLVALFAYGSLATLFGVALRRPYLYGLLYVLGLEALIFVGRSLLVNGRPLLQDWVQYISLGHWVREAFAGWDPTVAFQWWPAAGEARTAFLVVVGIALGCLALSAWWVQQREFEV